VRRYLHAGNVETLLAGGVRSSVLDPVKSYLHERMASGERKATVLLDEITERGYTAARQQPRSCTGSVARQLTDGDSQ
jgi:hypothetical protein